MEIAVERLRPGDIFRVDFPYGKPREYRLIYVSSCRAYVEPLKQQKMDALDDEEKKKGRTNISPGTLCTRISTRDALDFDDEEMEFVDSVPLPRLDYKDALADDNEPEEVTTMKDALADDFEDALGGDNTPAKPKRTRGPRSADGVRRKEPGIQTREIKDGTVRAKLFAAMKKTKSIEKLSTMLNMKKALLLSHVNEFNRAHGFGYTIDAAKDRVELIPPKKVAIKK